LHQDHAALTSVNATHQNRAGFSGKNNCDVAAFRLEEAMSLFDRSISPVTEPRKEERADQRPPLTHLCLRLGFDTI
jgi:hypothetical protein